MKKIVLSSVATVAVVGMIALSGCGGDCCNDTTEYANKKMGKIDPNAKSESTIKITLDENGNVTKATPTKTTNSDKTGTQGTQVTVTKVNNCKDSSGASTTCENKCTTEAPCEVKVTTGCTRLSGYGEKEALIEAFSDFKNSDKTSIGNDEKLAYSGYTELSSGDINGCTIDFSTFIVCAVDGNGKKYFISKDETSAGYVWVEVVYEDSSKAPEWRKVPLQWRNNGEEDGQPYMNIDDLKLSGTPASIKVYSILKKSAKPHGTLVTGISGGTGLSGSGE